MLGKTEGRRRRGRQRVIWLDRMDMMDMMVIWLDSAMDMTVSKLQEIVKDRKPGMLQSTGKQRVRELSNWTAATTTGNTDAGFSNLINKSI